MTLFSTLSGRFGRIVGNPEIVEILAGMDFTFICLRFELCGYLSTWRAVKDSPYDKILGNLLHLVLDSCGHEQEVA
jgi:hypothetical protein